MKRIVGRKIKVIRMALTMNQKEFCEHYNDTKPKDLQMTAASLGMYERGKQNCPSDKYEKILSFQKA